MNGINKKHCGVSVIQFFDCNYNVSFAAVSFSYQSLYFAFMFNIRPLEHTPGTLNYK